MASVAFSTSFIYRAYVEDNEFRFVAVSEADWRQLRGAWLDMIAAVPGDDVEALEDAVTVSESGWRRRARALTDIDCFAQALVDPQGRWLGFVSAYFDDLASDRNAFLTHLHAMRDGVETENLLLERVASWAGLFAAEALVVGIQGDRTDLLTRFEDHGFRRTGVRRPCDTDPSRYEVELAFDLAASSLGRVRRHQSLRTA